MLYCVVLCVRLLSTLSGCLGVLYHHSPDLPSILQDTTVCRDSYTATNVINILQLFDLADYPPLVALGFSQPLLEAIDLPTDLGTLTSSLSVLLKLLNKVCVMSNN